MTKRLKQFVEKALTLYSAIEITITHWNLLC